MAHCLWPAAKAWHDGIHKHYGSEPREFKPLDSLRRTRRTRGIRNEMKWRKRKRFITGRPTCEWSIVVVNVRYLGIIGWFCLKACKYIKHTVIAHSVLSSTHIWQSISYKSVTSNRHTEIVKLWILLDLYGSAIGLTNYDGHGCLRPITITVIQLRLSPEVMEQVPPHWQIQRAC